MAACPISPRCAGTTTAGCARRTSRPPGSSSSTAGSPTPSPPTLPEPNAVVVATADADGAPDARIVLMKGYDESGFSSAPATPRPRAHSSRSIRAPPSSSRGTRCSGRCGWPAGSSGSATGRPTSLCDPRPRGAQLAAAASVQSTVVASGAELVERVAAARRADPGRQGAPADGLGRVPGRAGAGGVLAGRRRPVARPVGVRAG